MQVGAERVQVALEPVVVRPVENAEVFLDEDFEEVRKITKTAAETVFNASSNPLKEALKTHTGLSIEKAIPYSTLPIKAAITMNSPAGIDIVLNKSVDDFFEPTAKQLTQYSIDRTVDVLAKKTVNQSVDGTLRSNQSFFTRVYLYITGKSE